MSRHANTKPEYFTIIYLLSAKCCARRAAYRSM